MLLLLLMFQQRLLVGVVLHLVAVLGRISPTHLLTCGGRCVEVLLNNGRVEWVRHDVNAYFRFALPAEASWRLGGMVATAAWQH